MDNLALEPNDDMYVICDDVCNAIKGLPKCKKIPNTPNVCVSEDEFAFVNKWDRINAITDNNMVPKMPNCQDIFVGRVPCSPATNAPPPPTAHRCCMTKKVRKQSESEYCNQGGKRNCIVDMPAASMMLPIDISDMSLSRRPTNKLSKKKNSCPTCGYLKNSSSIEQPKCFNRRKPSCNGGGTSDRKIHKCPIKESNLRYLSEIMEQLKRMDLDEHPCCKEFLSKTDCSSRKKPSVKRMSVRRPKRSNLCSRNQLFQRTRKSIPATLRTRPSCPCPYSDDHKRSDRHDTCNADVPIIPKNMGWDWHRASEERKGWRPGAIPKAIRELMCHFLSPCPCDTLLPYKKRSSRRSGDVPADCGGDEPQLPTLRVQRRNHEYYITMNPLKDAQRLKTEPYPYVACKPLQFRISGSTEERALHDIKKIIKEQGFEKCTCGKAIAKCSCRDNREMEALRKCLVTCENRFGIDNADQKICLAEKSSELDIEFTPPAGIVKANLPPVADLVVQETQYDELDYRVVAEKPGKGGGGKKGGKGGKGKDGADDGDDETIGAAAGADKSIVKDENDKDGGGGKDGSGKDGAGKGKKGKKDGGDDEKSKGSKEGAGGKAKGGKKGGSKDSALSKKGVGKKGNKNK